MTGEWTFLPEQCRTDFFVWITACHGRVHEKRPKDTEETWIPTEEQTEQAKSRFKIVFWGVGRDKSGRIGFFGSSGGTSGFGLQIGTVPTRSGRLAGMWAYQEIQKECLPFTWTQCWCSRTQTIDRFIASMVTKNLSIILEEPILPRTPPSSFPVSCILPRTFPKTWSNAFMQNSWHTISFDELWLFDSLYILMNHMAQFQR